MPAPTLLRRNPVAFTLISAAPGVVFGIPIAAAASVDDPVIYSENRTSESTIQDRDPGYKPMYLVYADKERTADEAKKLVDDLGLTRHVQDYKTRVFVVGPSNGNTYDDAADLTAYQNFLKTHRSSNLKIVAVGAGSTFVNSLISKHAYAVAGIMTYGGSIAGGTSSSMPVPAYVHTTDPAVAKLYIQANGATSKVEAPRKPGGGQSVNRIANSRHATIYAFDSANGKLLWSSGDQITGWNHGSGMTAINGKAYISTFDGYFYCFGVAK